jgi:hypothetical protein
MGGIWFPLMDKLQPQEAIYRCDGAPPYAKDGVPLPLGTELPPLVWQAHFSPKIMRCLVTNCNPEGTITNLDLELAASIVQCCIGVQHFDVQE